MSRSSPPTPSDAPDTVNGATPPLRTEGPATPPSTGVVIAVVVTAADADPARPSSAAIARVAHLLDPRDMCPPVPVAVLDPPRHASPVDASRPYSPESPP